MSSKGKKHKGSPNTIALNKKARFEFFIEENVEAGIALALVPTALAKPGTELAVEIRGKAEPAVVVKRPFYRRG